MTVATTPRQSTRPEIGARLDHLCFESPDPARLAAFYAEGFGMTQAVLTQDTLRCTAAGREILVRAGAPNRTAWIAFGFESEAVLGSYRAALAARSLALHANPSPSFTASAFAVADPDGNTVVFGARPATGASSGGLPARLQHVAFRTPNLDAMTAFYERSLGFVVSDRVRDAQGVLRAAFLRTDEEHHALALFGAPEKRFDHHSSETLDWEHIRRWADHVAARRIPIFWGVGRHGPGNDLFFMVKDPDDNLAEISAEIEQCTPDRAEGLWPHEQRTLNLWGSAIMRS